jgi:hypothetical protein
MKNKRTAKIFGAVAGLVITAGITWGAFKWGVYYARNTPHPQVLSIEPERNIIITNEFVKVMNNASDSVAFAIWHGGYLYTPDTAMYQLVMFGKTSIIKSN